MFDKDIIIIQHLKNEQRHESKRGQGTLGILFLPTRSSDSQRFYGRPVSEAAVGHRCRVLTASYVILNHLFKCMVSVLYFHSLGPEEAQKEVEPHHTVVFEDGDCIQVENKVRMQ